MTDAIFTWIVQASWQAGIAVVLVVAAQTALRNYLTPRWRYALWLPVLIALLMPTFTVQITTLAKPTASFESTHIEEAAVSPQEYLSWATALVQSHDPTIAQAESRKQLEAGARARLPRKERAKLNAAVANPPSGPIDWRFWMLAVWLSGVGVMGLYCVMSHWRLLRRLSLLSRKAGDHTAHLAAEISGIYHIKTPLIRCCNHIGAPLVVGLTSPVLVLPVQQMDDADLRHCLAHECAHLRARDQWWNLLTTIIIVCHWFNPLLWWAQARYRDDREAVRDQQATQALKADPVSYAKTLIDLVAARITTPLVTPMGATRAQLTRRIVMLTRPIVATLPKKVLFSGVILGLFAFAQVRVAFTAQEVGASTPTTSPVEHGAVTAVEPPLPHRIPSNDPGVPKEKRKIKVIDVAGDFNRQMPTLLAERLHKTVSLTVKDEEMQACLAKRKWRSLCPMTNQPGRR